MVVLPDAVASAGGPSVTTTCAFARTAAVQIGTSHSSGGVVVHDGSNGGRSSTTAMKGATRT